VKKRVYTSTFIYSRACAFALDLALLAYPRPAEQQGDQRQRPNSKPDPQACNLGVAGWDCAADSHIIKSITRNGVSAFFG